MVPALLTRHLPVPGRPESETPGQTKESPKESLDFGSAGTQSPAWSL